MHGKLEHKHIKIRAVEPEDIDWIYQCENDPEIWHLSNTHMPFSKHVLRRFIQQSEEELFLRRQMRLIIAEHDNTPCGILDFFDFDPFHLRAGIGIMIDKDKRTKGYAKEALSLTETYAFDHLKLHQLYCNISKSNTPSIRLFESAGFTLCGTKKDWLKIKSGFEDELMYQLLNPSG